MKYLDKLSLSACIIKRAYAGYSPPMPGNAQSVAAGPVPKAIPVSPAKTLPNSGILGPAVSLLDAEMARAAPAKVTKQVAKRVPVISAPKPAVAYTSPYQPILDIIRKGESNVAGYETMVGSNKPFDLTKKTLQQVLDIQDQRLKAYGGTAAGGYQILKNNLRDLAKQHKHDLNKTLFDQATQDTYAKSLMDRRGFQNFLKGKINADQMRVNLAKEWAALPAKGELSYYHGKGTNKARVSAKDINAAIAKALELHRQAIKQ